MTVPTAAIIGGGPAGCAAAISAGTALAGSGANLILFEAGSINNDKPCAGGLTPDCVRLLDDFGLDNSILREIGGFSVRKIIARHGSRHPTEYDIGPGAGCVVSRTALDRWLRRRASKFCELRYGARVTDVERSGTRWRLSYSTQAGPTSIDVDLIILANGSTGMLSKKRGVDGKPTLGTAIIQNSHTHRLTDALHFAFTESLAPGYVWWFPTGDSSVNWGACLLIQRRCAALSDLRLRMSRLARFSGYTMPRSAPAHLWSGNGMHWHNRDGILSCGDAAGLIDPYSGEGISAALLSGKRAGRAGALFLGGSRGTLIEYSDWVNSFFEREYDRDGARAQFWRKISSPNTH